jgi:hypothetical protein
MANQSSLGTSDAAGHSGGSPGRVVIGIHVSAVGLLAADLACTWALRGLSRSQVVLLSAVLLWLAIVAHIWLRLRNGSTAKKFVNALVALTSVMVVFAVFELGLRLLFPDTSGYLRPPNSHYKTQLDDRYTPGVHGLANFTTNEWGLRAP